MELSGSLTKPKSNQKEPQNKQKVIGNNPSMINQKTMAAVSVAHKCAWCRMVPLVAHGKLSGTECKLSGT